MEQFTEAPATPVRLPTAGLIDYGLAIALVIWVGQKLWQSIKANQTQDQVVLSTLLANQQEFFRQQSELNTKLIQLIELRVKTNDN